MFSTKDCGGDTTFWYAVEDTLQSDIYILEHEQRALKFWIKALVKYKKQSIQPYCLDIGANGGFYSLASRSLGCSVLTIDARPRCLARLHSSAAVNNYKSKFSLRLTAVSAETNELTVDVASNNCSGLWAIKNSGAVNNESKSSIKVNSKTLLEIVNDWIDSNDVIALLKIDAEGSEFSILKSALPLFKSKRILNTIVNIAPGRADKLTSWEDIQFVIKSVYSSGYYFTESIQAEGTSGASTLDQMIQKMGTPSSTHGSIEDKGRKVSTLFRISLF